MNRLATKLVVAFAGVAVLASGIVFLLANLATGEQFASYVQQSSMTVPPMIRTALVQSYAQQQSWSGVEAYLQQLDDVVGGRLVVTDTAGNVLADSSRRDGKPHFSDGELRDRITVKLDDGENVYLLFLPTNRGGRGPQGWMGGMSRMMGMMQGQGIGDIVDTPGTPESTFLSRVSSSMWLALIIAGLLASALGLLLVRQITHPLAMLTDAATRIAQGDLTKRVNVRSTDEVGVLASAFNQMADSLAINENRRRQLAADIAHELRTPLTVIQGNLEAMRDGVRLPTQEALASVHEESKLLARLVDDLRDLSLAEAGQLTLRLEQANLSDLVTGTIASIHNETMDKKITVKAIIADESPVLADTVRLGQVLRNLLNNALKHTPEGGRITVTVKWTVRPATGDKDATSTRSSTDPSPASDSWMEVSVEDDGSGIDVHDLPHVFDRFYRADKSRARSSGGSGIGLAIVKQLVNAHHGQVWVSSEVGRGTKFTFALPALEEVHHETTSSLTA